MARRYFSSTAVRTTISSGVSSSATSVTVAATTGFPTSYPWSAILDQDTASEEVVEVTAAAGSTLTVIRGVDGTTAVSHSSGATFNHGVSARDYSEPNVHVNDQQPHITACTSSSRPGSPTTSQIIFETDTKRYYGWDGSAWSSIGGGSNLFVLYEYTATTGQTTFSGADLNGVTLAYTAGLAQVYLNGVLLMPGDDYTATNGTSIVLLVGATVGDSLAVEAFATATVSNTYTRSQVDALIAGAGLNPFLLMGV